MTVRLAERSRQHYGCHHRRRVLRDLLGDLVVATETPVGVKALALFAAGLVLCLTNVAVLYLQLIS